MLSAKVRAWAAATGAKSEALLADLERLSHQSPEQIAAQVLSRSPQSEASGSMTQALGQDAGTPVAQRSAAGVEAQLF